MLKLFLVDGAANLRNGFMYVHRGFTEIAHGVFKGFLADEKGLKEFFDFKGASGTKPCICCKNVKNFIHKTPENERRADDYVVALDVVDRKLLDPHTNASVFVMVDRLRAAFDDPNVTQAQFDELQQLFGLNYNPSSVLFCDELRSFIKPIDHYIRDWQHTLVSSGVASTQLAACIAALRSDPTCKKHGIKLETIEQYTKHFIMPSKMNKVNMNWFRSKFVATDHVKHFSSDVLCMVPLLTSFLVQAVRPLGCMLEHIDCMQMLCELLAVLQYHYSLGAAEYSALRQLVDDHHALFQKLYAQHVKVKFHHLMHLPEDLYRLGSVVSCFVTERKHRDWKRMSLYAFSNVELQSTVDFVNYSVQELVSGRFRYDAHYLLNPSDYRDMQYSSSAMCGAGHVQKGDVIVLITEFGKIIGEVLRFFQQDTEMHVQVDAYLSLGNNDFDTSVRKSLFTEISAIRAKCMWCRRQGAKIHVLVPPGLFAAP